jgi:hypothetical protein
VTTALAAAEAFNTTNLVALYGGHRTAFYQLWNYLWLVIAASITTSYAVEPGRLGSPKLVLAFRAFVFLGFAFYAAVNYNLLDEVRVQMQLTYDAIQDAVGANDKVAGSLQPRPRSALIWTHIGLDLLVTMFHGILIVSAWRATKR